MNAMEILEVVRNPVRLNMLADEFRKNPDIAELMVLLNSENDEIADAGAWIAGEVDIGPEDAQVLIPRLRHLVTHDNPSLRFHAIGALYPFLDKTDSATKKMLTELSADVNEGVRSIAQAALTRISQRH